MALTGSPNVAMDVSIVMAAALPPNAPHTVVFSGPLAGPDELQINSGALTFDDTNWSTPQLVNVTPRREGTVHMNYSITSPYTRTKKTGSVELFIVAAQDQFIQKDPYIGASAVTSIFWQEIGYYDASVINTTLKLVATGQAPAVVTIHRKSPSGVFLTITSGLTYAMPEVGRYRFFARSSRSIHDTDGLTATITATDSAGVTPYNYQRLLALKSVSSQTATHFPWGPTLIPFSMTSPPLFTSLVGVSPTLVGPDSVDDIGPPAPTVATEIHYISGYSGVGSLAMANSVSGSARRNASVLTHIVPKPSYGLSKIIPTSGGPVGDANETPVVISSNQGFQLIWP